MTAALLWKEYREHRAIWLAMVAVAALALLVPAQIFAVELATRTDLRDALGVVALVLAWAYGAVCGAMLLAGERENGTQPYLDVLPVWRRQLWQNKTGIGFFFVALYTAVLVGLGIAADLPKSLPEGPFARLFVGVGALALAAVVGYGWGLFASARCGNVLQAIALALVWMLVGVALTLLASLLFGAFLEVFLRGLPTWPISLVLFAPLFLAAPYIASARQFTSEDRCRRPALEVVAIPAAEGTEWWPLMWLAWRQMRGLAGSLILFSLGAGLLLPVVGLLLWPLATLTLGALCGVTAFQEEQQTGANRFLANGRFPLGRVWLVKVGFRLALALTAALAMLFSGTVGALLRLAAPPTPQVPFSVHLFGSLLLGGQVSFLNWLFLWVLHGVAIGHVCGLLFRKSLVAMVVALGASVLLVAPWTPSLVAGGLPVLPALAVPLIVFAVGRSLVYPWAAGRVPSWTVNRRVAAGLTVAGLLIAGGLGWRILEIPNVAEPREYAEFLESLPTPEENPVGNAVRSAALRGGELLRSLSMRQPQFQRAGGAAAGMPPERGEDVALRALEHGWPAKGGEQLGAWLDEVFADDWSRRLAAMAGRPPGLVEDPRRLSANDPLRAGEVAPELARVLALRGLQKQKQGDPAEFVSCLKAGLALSAGLQHRSPPMALLFSWRSEGQLLRGLDRWLEAFEGDPARLRELREILQRHLRQTPTEFGDQQRAAYLIARESLQSPERWLLQGWRDQYGGQGQPELAVILANAACLVPWEEARLDRILRAEYWGNPREQAACLSRDYLPILLPRFNSLERGSRHRLADLRVAVLKLALREYQARHGQPASSLAQLVPGFLAEVPHDPHDGKPFRYRLSRGERILDLESPGGPQVGAGGVPGGPPPLPEPEPGLWVPPEQGILWSVGEDGRDDGGIRQGRNGGGGSGTDQIYLVPRPAGQRGR